jgi:hypothetical protein
VLLIHVTPGQQQVAAADRVAADGGYPVPLDAAEEVGAQAGHRHPFEGGVEDGPVRVKYR